MFQVLQEWEGYVIDIGEDEFTARLLDLTAGSSHEEEEAVIPLAEISEDDLKHLRLGSIFRWASATRVPRVELSSVSPKSSSANFLL